jgi:hypothetical protein
MKPEFDGPAANWGLLANGSSGRWHVDVDESLDGGEWSLEINGPQTELRFRLLDLGVIAKALRMLQSESELNRTNSQTDVTEEDGLLLGRFGSASVSLRQDREDFPRCFIVVSPSDESTLFLRLWAEDIRMLSEALQQVMEDLQESDDE